MVHQVLRDPEKGLRFQIGVIGQPELITARQELGRGPASQGLARPFPPGETSAGWWPVHTSLALGEACVFAQVGGWGLFFFQLNG